MERRYYDTESLSRALKSFEERYRLSSIEFYEAHQADAETAARIPRFHRHVWASFYRDVRRLSGEDFAADVERALELA